MSQDFKIQNLCDHRILREEAYLNANRKDIVVSLPIASMNTIKVFINCTEINKEDYEVIDSERSQKNYPRVVIRMKNRINIAYPLIDVDYTTFSEKCPKCLGVNINDDIKISQEGDITLVRDENYLVQQVEKFIITRLGSNKFHSWMGTTLQEMVGSKIIDEDLIKARITDQVNTAIAKLTDMQDQLIKAGFTLTAGERYGRTKSILVEQMEDDPTIFEITLSFLAKSGKTIEYSQYYELSQFRQRLNV